MTLHMETLTLGSGWRARIYRDWEFSPDVLAAWDALARGYGDTGIFLGPGWYEQWWTAFGVPGELCTVVLEEYGEVRGVFPCGAGTEPASRTTVNSLTNDHSFYFDFLVQPESRDRVMAMFVRLLQVRKSKSIMRFDELANDGANGALFSKTLRRRGYPVHDYAEPWAPWVDLQSSWETYESGLHSKLRNNLKKGRRRAEREGTLAFEVVQDSPRLEELLSQAFDVEDKSWKGEEGTSMKSDARVEQFYRRVARWGIREGKFYLFTLRMNGQLIAFDFCLTGDRTMFALKTGYDQSVAARFSPGNLMRHEVLRFLFSRREFDRYNFLGPCYPWKLEWNAVSATHRSLKVFPRNLGGWSRYGYQFGFKSALKRVLVAGERIPGFPKLSSRELAKGA